MAGIKLEVFGGMIPAVDKRLLPPNNAQDSQNVWLYDGRIRGLRLPKEVYTLINPEARRVYRIPLGDTAVANIINSRWLEFNSATVSIVKTPIKDILDPRYYWAGESPTPSDPMYTTLSRIMANVDPLHLGIPEPTAALTSVVPSGGASAILETRSYTLTYVSVYGEEGPPATPLAPVTGKIDDTWTVTIPAVPTVDRGDPTLTITGITQATEAEVTTSASHNYTVGMRVFFRAVVGMTQINNLHGTVVSITNATKFKVNINSTGFTAYGSAGTVQRVFREITKANIYRTVTNDQNVPTYYFVAQVNTGVTTYADTASSQVVSQNEPMSSMDYDPPPQLDGFVSMPNGMIIGWLDNQVYFCEPYKPHAWPAIYSQAVAFNIVGIGVVGQSAVLCTEGLPYLCTGTHPSNMNITNVGATPYPCSSQNSIAVLPAGVFYGSNQGIIMVGPGAPAVVTKSLASQDKWQALVATNRLNSAVLNGAYVGYSGTFEGVFEETAFESTAFEMGDVTDVRAGLWIDFDDARVAMNRLLFSFPPKNLIQDAWTAEVLVVMNSKVYVLEQTNIQDEGPYIWWSKEFRMDRPTNLGAGRIFYNNPDTLVTPTGTLTVYGDGVQVYTRALPAHGEEFRLPAGAQYDFYSFKVEGNYEIQSMQFATTTKELRGL